MRMTPVLPVGPPGLGKTAFAQVVAGLLGTELQCPMPWPASSSVAWTRAGPTRSPVRHCAACCAATAQTHWRCSARSTRQRAMNATSRWGRCTPCWNLRLHGASATTGCRCPSMPARSSGWPPPTMRRRSLGPWSADSWSSRSRRRHLSNDRPSCAMSGANCMAGALECGCASHDALPATTLERLCEGALSPREATHWLRSAAAQAGRTGRRALLPDDLPGATAPADWGGGGSASFEPGVGRPRRTPSLAGGARLR